MINFFIGPFAVACNGRAKGPMPFTLQMFNHGSPCCTASLPSVREILCDPDHSLGGDVNTNADLVEDRTEQVLAMTIVWWLLIKKLTLNGMLPPGQWTQKEELVPVPA